MLTERQKNIMIAIVEAYTENEFAEPIGSGTLTKQEGLNFSTATLRNEMAALEEMGYLEKTHTSSGRIPTEKGYRLYVDSLMDVDYLTFELDDQVEKYFNDQKESKVVAAEKLLTQVIDNKDFNYGAIFLEKTAYNSRLKKIDFIHLKNYRGIFLMVTDHGLVLHREIQVPEGISIKNIENTVEYLNEQLHDILLNDIKNAKNITITNQGFFDYMTNAPLVLEFVLRNILRLVEDKKKVIGPYNILKHNDLGDITFAQNYLDSLKNESIYQIVEFDSGPLPVLSSTETMQVSVKIGSEIGLSSLKTCSAVTAIYQSSLGTGAITVFGPMRMKYRYIIAILSGIIKNMN